jgi:hypothetical protein
MTVVGERKQPIPGKGYRWWWFAEEKNPTRSLTLTLGWHMPWLSHALLVT